MIHVKPGVQFNGLRREIYALWARFEEIFAEFGLPLRITCATDSHGPDDPHSHGCGIDLDTHEVPGQSHELSLEEKHQLVDWLREAAAALGGDIYYIFLENEGQQTEHIHCQVRKDLWRQLVADS